MSSIRIWQLLVASFVSMASGIPADGPDKAKSLSADDQKLLAGLIEQFLFDPRGARRVRVRTIAWMVGRGVEVEREGWLVTAKDGQPARVHFIDGANIPAPKGKDLTTIDFVSTCRARLERTRGSEDEDEVVLGFSPGPAWVVRSLPAESDLVLAAWLYRLGETELATKALARARAANATDVGELRERLARHAFFTMVYAYSFRADDEALAHGERLLRLYPEEAKNYWQTKPLLDELRRRQRTGTFGRFLPRRRPAELDTWDVAKKIAYLIDALDEVDDHEFDMGQPKPLSADPCIDGLIRIGDRAVLALIDVVENDKRLTRVVQLHHSRGNQGQTVLGVRDIALIALHGILQLDVVDGAIIRDNLTCQGEKAARQAAAQLRAYWKRYGTLSVDERLMKTLTDPHAKVERLREAARNLGLKVRSSIWKPEPYDYGSPAPLPTPCHVTDQFSKPSAAEAILAAMDRDLAAFDAGQGKDAERREIEDGYLQPLVELGDRRLAPELAKRCRTASTVRMRRHWAYACYWLGDPKPLTDFANDFRRGQIGLPPNLPGVNADGQPGTVELQGIIAYLTRAGTPEGDRALTTLADPFSPYHQLAKQQVLAEPFGWRDRNVWFAHPFCLTILGSVLEDTRPTGATFDIDDNCVWCHSPGSSRGEGLPEFLKDPANRGIQATERICDRAAWNLSKLVVGLPVYHPLLKDADQHLKALAAAFDRSQGRFRPLSRTEAQWLQMKRWDPCYLPDFRPLDRPATAEDVRAGRALFHLDGNGKRADLKMPAHAVLKEHADEPNPPRVLIVQAEVQPTGETIYGIIGAHDMRAVPGKELRDIQPAGGKR